MKKLHRNASRKRCLILFVTILWVSYSSVFSETESLNQEWGGINADANEYVDTGDWLGWVLIKHQPWIWSWSLNHWIYAADPGAAAQGVWAYLPASMQETSPTTTSLSQFGITWTFTNAVKYGQFANGDYWVVDNGDGVQIASITPGWDGSRNGTMVNPMPNQSQGFDSRVQWFNYDADKNIADDLPYMVTKAESIVSSISVAATQTYQLDTVAILTVLDEVPPEGAFRPPYSGADKSIIATIDDLDYTKLQSLDSSRISNIPNLTTLAMEFERPWIDLNSSFYAAHLHPISNQETYGREIARHTSQAGLVLNLNLAENEKERLLIPYVQLGMDIYGLAKNGHVWRADGGHKQGRKLPLLIAGWVLQNQNMLDWADAAKNFIFQEDLQTGYVDQTLVDITNSSSWSPDTRNPTRRPYNSSDLGNPEWAIRFDQRPEASDADWNASYRVVNGSNCTATCLTAYVMGLESQWNWPAFFEYHITRYWPTEKNEAGFGTNEITAFCASVWNAYGPK